MFYLRPKARQILSLFPSAIYSGWLFFPLASRAQLASALELAGLFCCSAARHHWLCTNLMFHMKEYFKNKPVTHVVYCDMYWEERSKWQNSVSHLHAFKSSFLPIADDRSCSLPSPFCRIEWVWDIVTQCNMGPNQIIWGPLHSPKLLPLPEGTSRVGHMPFGPGSHVVINDHLQSIWISPTFSSWGPGSASLFSLRKKQVVWFMILGFRAIKDPCPSCSGEGAPTRRVAITNGQPWCTHPMCICKQAADTD